MSIYRPTRNAPPGVYYTPLTNRQARRVLARWAQALRTGSIKGRDYGNLQTAHRNPSWRLWRRLVRIRKNGRTREITSVVALPPEARLRAIKRKPSPLVDRF